MVLPFVTRPSFPYLASTQPLPRRTVLPCLVGPSSPLPGIYAAYDLLPQCLVLPCLAAWENTTARLSKLPQARTNWRTFPFPINLSEQYLPTYPAVPLPPPPPPPPGRSPTPHLPSSSFDPLSFNSHPAPEPRRQALQPIPSQVPPTSFLSHQPSSPSAARSALSLEITS